jgi:autoinducer 2-degrading protein
VSYVLQVFIHIRPDGVDRFLPLLKANAEAARGEAGCERFEIFIDPDEPSRMMLLEIYASEEAFQAHLRTDHFRRYSTEAVPLLASRERKVWRRS